MNFGNMCVKKNYLDACRAFMLGFIEMNHAQVGPPTMVSQIGGSTPLVKVLCGISSVVFRMGHVYI